MTTEAIIVYRSRTEQAFDTALWDGSLIPFAAAVLAFLVVIYVILQITNSRSFYQRFRDNRWIWKFNSSIMLALAALAALAAFKLTMVM
jgi:hypothetical protein